MRQPVIGSITHAGFTARPGTQAFGCRQSSVVPEAGLTRATRTRLKILEYYLSLIVTTFIDYIYVLYRFSFLR